MSTQEKPSLLKWYVLKAVIAALVVFAGYKVFFENPISEQAVPTHEERKEHLIDHFFLSDDKLPYLGDDLFPPNLHAISKINIVRVLEGSRVR